MPDRVVGPEIERLIQLLARLPGYGPRSARRAALHLMRKREELLSPLADALRIATERIVTCESCGSVDTRSPCSICGDDRRDAAPLVIVETVADLSGLGQTNPAMAFFLAMIMFSLAGVPPLAGFFAKFYVFQAAIQANLYTLAVVGVLASVVAAYYYLRIVKMMYFDPSAEAFDRQGPATRVILAISGLVMLFFWVYPAPVVGAATAAAHSLF